MSITSAMFTGVTGLLANAEGINVIGNNLANVNTIGFKSGRMLFSDMLSTNINNGSQIGRGTQIQKVDNVFGQSSFETTENVTDLAIQGNSFFAVKDPNAASPVAQNGAMLTRAGAFRLDSTSTLVNPDNYQVLDTQGNPIKFSDNASAIATATGDLTAATATAAGPAYTTASTAIQAQTATLAGGGTNDAAAFAAAIGALAGVSPAETAAAGAISAAATAADTAAAAAVATPTATTIAAAQTAFNNLNTLTNSYSATFTTTGANALYSTFQTALSTSNTAVNTAVTTAAATIAADPAVVAAKAQLATANGLAFGKISSIDPSGLITYLGKDGITLNYYNTSGQVGIAANAANALTVQRLAVVTAANPGGLEKAGGTLFKPTTASGITSASFTLANNSANGSSEKIYTNSLEQSNVDMAGQFVKMILTQRAYSANSKTITTADEMTQEVLNLKR